MERRGKAVLGMEGHKGLNGPCPALSRWGGAGPRELSASLGPFPSERMALPPARPVQLLAPLASGLPLAAATSSPRHAALAHSNVPRPITSCYTDSIAYWAPSFREKPCGSGDLQAGFGPKNSHSCPCRGAPRRLCPLRPWEKACRLRRAVCARREVALGKKGFSVGFGVLEEGTIRGLFSGIQPLSVLIW